MIVRPVSRHAANNGIGLFRSTTTMFTALGLSGSQLRMPAPFPVNRQYDLASFFVDVGNDVFH
jgi:hypothetical protein